MIWGPSILLLEAIGEPGSSWRKESSLLPLYRSLTSQYPALFEGIDLVSYLEFFAKVDLIAHRDGCVCLSDAGSEFLTVVTGAPRRFRYAQQTTPASLKPRVD